MEAFEVLELLDSGHMAVKDGRLSGNTIFYGTEYKVLTQG
jgi:hypothetical protein